MVRLIHTAALIVVALVVGLVIGRCSVPSDPAPIQELKVEIVRTDSVRQNAQAAVISSRRKYQAVRDTLLRSVVSGDVDTALIGRVVAAADSTLTADSTALALGDTAVRQRDSLITLLENRPEPRYQFYAEALWDTQDGELVRAGVQRRLPIKHTYLIGEVERAAGELRARVGVKVVF